MNQPFDALFGPLAQQALLQLIAGIPSISFASFSPNLIVMFNEDMPIPTVYNLLEACVNTVQELELQTIYSSSSLYTRAMLDPSRFKTLRTLRTIYEAHENNWKAAQLFTYIKASLETTSKILASTSTTSKVTDIELKMNCHGRISELPSTGYGRKFTVQYARIAGLDPNKLLAQHPALATVTLILVLPQIQVFSGDAKQAKLTFGTFMKICLETALINSFEPTSRTTDALAKPVSYKICTGSDSGSDI
ncbi:hypothetical protein CPB83DRAFT_562833 [Crepidotus variabilis]|uniref:Uncharacterized protein n=1 Tax=Crepidotus variabilis TaxID=179855 RepID=A0A9P6E9U2_9AGAR|nr:hypothetical protein CPB83DRAFT_562833 [Crepidotus variabilis]